MDSGVGMMMSDFGIEVELEGTVMPIPDTVYWCSKPDTSLRQGWEYVLLRPVPETSLKNALLDLSSILSVMKPKTSIRTSTHIHINVLRLTIREIFNVIFLYYLLEELLIRTQPDSRIGNLFCLRMKDSKSIYHFLKDEILHQRYFGGLSEEGCKYGAMNLATIRKYGSLEFRFLQAMTDPFEIEKWCRVFFRIVHEGKKQSCEEMLSAYDAIPVKRFLSERLAGFEFLWENFTSDSLNDLLHTNYDSLRELSRVFSQNDYYTLPLSMWEEDIDESTLYDYDEYSSGTWDAPPDPWHGGMTHAQALHHTQAFHDALALHGNEIPFPDPPVQQAPGFVTAASWLLTHNTATNQLHPTVAPTPPVPVPNPTANQHLEDMWFNAVNVNDDDIPL